MRDRSSTFTPDKAIAAGPPPSRDCSVNELIASVPSASPISHASLHPRAAQQSVLRSSVGYIDAVRDTAGEPMVDNETPHPLRPLLKNWVWEHGRVGTRYLDCSAGEVKFDDGKKARFADRKVFYVSLAADADERNIDGPTIHESGLAQFLRAAQSGKPESAGTVAEVQRAAQDCLDLALVCAYQPAAEAALARYALEPMFDDEIRAAVIDDIRSSYVGLRSQLALYDFTVFHGLPAPLLISEAPFIDWRVRARPVQPFVSLPLGPYCLLVGTPSGKTSRAGPVLWKSASTMGPFKEHNRYIVENARDWIVAITDDELAAISERFVAQAASPPDADGVAPPQ
jgi:hypothetical protein